MATPKTHMIDTRRFPRFAGVATFCRYPLLELVPPECRPLDWVLYGVPFDSGTTYRPGARFGPRAIRDASQYVKRYSMEHQVDVTHALSLADGGDAPVNPYDIKASLDATTAHALTLGESTTKLLAVGGDHTTAYANIRATWERQGRPKGGLAVIHFDSHLDTVDRVWDEPWGHASVFRRAAEDGLIDTATMLSVGIKGPLNAAADLDFARDHGIQVVTADGFRAGGLAAIAAFVARLAGRAAYLTLDIDVVDPAFAPGTGTPSIGGLTSWEALSAIRACAGANIVGADVVEVLPDRDVAGNTALLAAHIMFEVLCLDAIRR